MPLPTSESRSNALEALAWVLLVLWLWGSRAGVAPTALIEWDSANYALALQDFDLGEHRPHPPGNPIFVALLALTRWAPGLTGPFVVTNAILGTAAIAGIGWMVRTEVGRWPALITAALFSACAPFWFHGAASTAYVAEATASVLGAVTALAVARRSAPLPALGVLLAVAIGIRPNIAITVLPVVVAAGLWAWPGWRQAMAAWSAFAVGCLAWLVPMLAIGGGWTTYRKTSGALWRWQVELGSILGDGSIVPNNLESLVLYVGDALHLLALAVVLNGLVAARRRTLDAPSLAFVALWFLPGAAFYGLHHLPKSGYVLSLLPPCFVLWAVALRDARHGLSGWADRAVVGANGVLASIWLALNLYGFGWSVPFDLLEWRDAPIPVPDPIILGGDYGRLGLLYRTWPHRHTAALLDQLDDDDDLALFLFGAHELMRVQMATRPDQWMAATTVDHGASYVQRGDDSDPSFGEFQLIVLEEPDIGLTQTLPTRIEVDGRRIRLARPGRSMDLVLDRQPRRLLVFTACPPCTWEVPDDGSNPAGKAIGGGFAAFEIPVDKPR